MNVIIVDRKDAQISLKSELLQIDSQKIPLHLIDTLLIVGDQKLQAADLTKLSSNSTHVVLFSSDFTKSAHITTTSSKNAQLKLAQYQACTTKTLPIAKTILSRKITAHAGQLQRHEISLQTHEILCRLDRAKTLDELLGIEGSFSRHYFTHYFSLFPKVLHKGRRTKRPPLDPLNALLSWFYTLIYHLIGVRLIGFGFEPSLGFLHRPFRSHMALASDILELYRADINQFVYEIFSQKIVTHQDFSKKSGVYLRYEGRKKLWQHFREFSASLEPRIDATITEIRGML